MRAQQRLTRGLAVLGNRPASHWQTARRAHGFPLVEVLVALSLMAVLALLSWRGLASMLRTRDSTGARINAVAHAQVSMLQWQ